MYYIYLVNESNSSKYKIGYTKNIETRLKTLQTSNAEKLEVIKLFPVDTKPKTIETYIHKGLSEYRRNGEWFEFYETPQSNIIEMVEYHFNKITENLNILKQMDNPFV